MLMFPSLSLIHCRGSCLQYFSAPGDPTKPLEPQSAYEICSGMHEPLGGTKGSIAQHSWRKVVVRGMRGNLSADAETVDHSECAV